VVSRRRACNAEVYVGAIAGLVLVVEGCKDLNYILVMTMLDPRGGATGVAVIERFRDKESASLRVISGAIRYRLRSIASIGNFNRFVTNDALRSSRW
jgi:hypothetical protein